MVSRGSFCSRRETERCREGADVGLSLLSLHDDFDLDTHLPLVPRVFGSLSQDALLGKWGKTKE